MKFCTHCGSELADEAILCPNCGCAAQTEPPKEDKRSVGLNILGFLFPLVGLILYLCLKKDTPVRAKSIGKWTLTGFIIELVLSIVMIVISVKLGVDLANDYLQQTQQNPAAITSTNPNANPSDLRTFELIDEGISETMAFGCDGDIIHTMIDTVYVDTEGATTEDIEAFKAECDTTYASLIALDFCAYSFTAEENQVVIKMTLTNLDNIENLRTVASSGIYDFGDTAGLLSMEATADSLCSNGWAER